MMKLRQWQEERLNEAVSIIKSSGKLMLSAPTGAGKTLFALLLGKILNKKIIFFTRTHSEFESVYKHGKMLGMNVAFLFGKTNACVFADKDVEPDEINCNVCKLMSKIKELSGSPSEVLEAIKEANDYCPYHSLKQSLKKDKNDVIVLTYPYLLIKQFRDSLGLNLNDYLIVIDEAHNLLESDKFFSRKITKRAIELALKELDLLEEHKLNVKEIREYLTSLHKFISSLVKDGSCHTLSLYPKPSPLVLEQIMKASNTIVNLNKSPVAKSHLRAVAKFLRIEGTVYNCNGSLVVIPDNIIKDLDTLFSSLRNVVLMSGTMPNLVFNGFRRIDVNISLGKSEYYLCEGVTSMKRTREINAEKYAEILTNIYNDSEKSVLVYFPSYEMLKLVKEKLSVPNIEETRKMTLKEIIELMQSKK